LVKIKKIQFVRKYQIYVKPRKQTVASQADLPASRVFSTPRDLLRLLLCKALWLFLTSIWRFLWLVLWLFCHFFCHGPFRSVDRSGANR